MKKILAFLNGIYSFPLPYTKWWKIVTLCVFSIISAAALLVYIVDPHYRYRLPKFYDTVYYEIYYTAPRLIKDSDFDLFMLGSSMCRNFYLDDIDRTFQCKSLKFAAAGATTFDLKKFIDLALEAQGKKLNRIVYSLDIYALNKTEPHYKNAGFMYRTDHKEDYKYLFDRQSYSSMLYILKRKLRPSGKRGIQTDRNKMFSTENAKTRYCHEEVVISAKHYATHGHAQRPYIPQSEKTLKTELLDLIDAHPEIEFTVYLPPYHIYSFCISEYLGEADELIKQRTRVLKELLKRKNVRLFDFQYIPEIAADSSRYHDIQHFSADTSRLLLRYLANGTYQLHSEDDILRTEQAFRKLLAGHMAQFTADLGLK